MPINSLQYQFEDARDLRLAQALNVCEMVRVVKTNLDGTLNLQPLCHKLMDGVYKQQPPLLNVPVLGIQGAGFAIKPSYQPGDVGIVVYGDHDKDNFQLTGEDGQPNTLRIHNKQDAFFVGVIGRGNPTQTIKISGSRIDINGNVYINGIAFSSHTHMTPNGGGISGGPQ